MRLWLTGQLLFLAQAGGEPRALQRRQVSTRLCRADGPFRAGYTRRACRPRPLERLATLVLRPYGDPCSAFDLVVVAGDGQAPFLLLGLAFGRKDLGIDQHLEVVAGLGDIDDDELLVNVHLGGRQSDARRRIHRLGHVADELLELRGEGRNGGRHLVEAGIRIFSIRRWAMLNV